MGTGIIRRATSAVRRLRRDDGVVTAEYAVLVALVALAVIAAAALLGLAIAQMFSSGASRIPNG